MLAFGLVREEEDNGNLVGVSEWGERYVEALEFTNPYPTKPKDSAEDSGEDSAKDTDSDPAAGMHAKRQKVEKFTLRF